MPELCLDLKCKKNNEGQVTGYIDDDASKDCQSCTCKESTHEVAENEIK